MTHAEAERLRVIAHQAIHRIHGPKLACAYCNRPAAHDTEAELEACAADWYARQRAEYERDHGSVEDWGDCAEDAEFIREARREAEA